MLLELERKKFQLEEAAAKQKGVGLWREYCRCGFRSDREVALTKVPANMKRIEDLVSILRFLGHKGAVTKEGVTKKNYLLQLLKEINIPSQS